MRLERKAALVTGGGRGIGAATASALAVEGAAVTVTDVDLAPAQEVVQRIQAAGGRALEEMAKERTPLRRVGRPEEVIAFLCTEDASFVSGQVIYVRGGPQPSCRSRKHSGEVTGLAMESALQQNGERRTKRLGVLTAAGIFWATLLVALGISFLIVLALVLFLGGVLGAIAVARYVPKTTVRRTIGTVDSRIRPFIESLAAWSARQLKVLRKELSTRRTAAASDRRLREAWRLSRAGTSLRNAGRVDEAVEQCASAAWAFRELGERRGEALALNSLGLAYARRGDSERAISAYEEAIGLLDELGESHAQGQVMANLAVALLGKDEPEEALAYWRSAFTHLEPGSPEHARMSEQLSAGTLR